MGICPMRLYLSQSLPSCSNCHFLPWFIFSFFLLFFYGQPLIKSCIFWEFRITVIPYRYGLAWSHLYLSFRIYLSFRSHFLLHSPSRSKIYFSTKTPTKTTTAPAAFFSMSMTSAQAAAVKERHHTRRISSSRRKNRSLTLPSILTIILSSRTQIQTPFSMDL